MEQIATIKVSVGAVLIALALSAATLSGHNRSMPKAGPVEGESESDVSEDMRRSVNGPSQDSALLNDLGRKNTDAVQDIIQRADHAAKNIEAISDELHRISNDDDPRTQELLDNLDEAAADAKELVATAKSELQSQAHR